VTNPQPEIDGELDPSMSGAKMVSILGFFSSHPRYAVWRVLLWYSIAALPFVIGVLLLALLLPREFDTIVAFVDAHGRKVVLYGLAALGFASGLGLTAGIAARAARSRMLVADSGNPPIGFGIAILALIALGTLPWLIPVSLDIDVRSRALLALLGVIPLLLVVAIASFAPVEDPGGRPVRSKIRWWTVVFPVLVLTVIALTRVGGIADAIGRWGWVDRIIMHSSEAKPSWDGTFVLKGDESGTLRGWFVTGIVSTVLAPVLCLAIMLVALLRDMVVGSSSERRRRQRPSAQARASARGLLGEGTTPGDTRRQKFGLSLEGSQPSGAPPSGSVAVPSEAEKGADAPPPWVERLREVVDPECRYGDWTASRFTPGETSPPYSGIESFRELFGGITPSADQVEAFSRVHSGFVSALGESDGRPVWGGPSSDVLLEGSPGSGRTSVVAAAAVHAVIVRGTTVLVIVPNASKRRALIRRIRRAAESSGVGWFLNVGDLTPAGRAAWTLPGDGAAETLTAQKIALSDDAAASVESAGERLDRMAHERRRSELERSRVAPGSTPDILVGTVQEFEESFFAGAADFLRKRAVLRRIGLVLVEDLERFDVRHRIHLPAILDKLRLLLGSEGHRPQTVVVGPRLHEVGRAFIVERMLSSKDRIDPCRLRPFSLVGDVGEPWQVTLRATDPGPKGVCAVIELCARQLAGDGIDVIVYSPAMSAPERRDLAASVETAGSASVTVVADLDELDKADAANLVAVFHAATGSVSASLAIRAQGGLGATVVFTVLPASTGKVNEAPTTELLVLPDGASRALFAAHYRSVARFIGRLRAVHRDLWCRLGLAPIGDLATTDGEGAGESAAQRYTDRTVLLDPPDSRVIRSGHESAWPWGAVSDAGAGGDGEASRPSAAPVDIDGLLDSSLTVEVSCGGAEFTVVSRNVSADSIDGVGERRISEWVSAADGQSIAFDDLAYASRLVLDRGDALFTPSNISERDGEGVGKIRIDGTMWSERGSSSGPLSLMVMQLRGLEIPPLFAPRRSLQSALPRHIRLLETEIDARRLAEIRAERAAERRRIEPRERRQFAMFDIEGVANDRGEVIRRKVTIRYEASSFFMLFGFNETDLAEDRVRTDLLGAWGPQTSSMRSPEPELGLAAAFSLRRLAPGLERLTRCIGFRLGDGPARGRAGLLFVEPTSTRRSAFRLVDWIVRDGGLLGEMLATMEQTLTEAGEGAGGPVSLLSRGEAAIGASISEDSLVVLDAARASRAAADIREARQALHGR
jgi:hypothetical protein